MLGHLGLLAPVASAGGHARRNLLLLIRSLPLPTILSKVLFSVGLQLLSGRKELFFSGWLKRKEPLPPSTVSSLGPTA